MRSLHTETRRLLIERPRTLTLAQIATKTNVPLRWLRNFSEGRAKHPCVDLTQTIYEFLSGKTLAI